MDRTRRLLVVTLNASGNWPPELANDLTRSRPREEPRPREREGRWTFGERARRRERD